MEDQNVLVLVASVSALTLVLVLGALLFRPSSYEKGIAVANSSEDVVQRWGVLRVQEQEPQTFEEKNSEPHLEKRGVEVSSPHVEKAIPPQEALSTKPPVVQKPQIVRQIPIVRAPPKEEKPVTVETNKEENSSSSPPAVLREAQKLQSLNAQKEAPYKEQASRYWIQLVTYTKRHHAEHMKEELLKKKIVSHIFTHQQGDTMYYRLRMGPYSEKQAVKEVLAAVKQEQGFEESYIIS